MMNNKKCRLVIIFSLIMILTLVLTSCLPYKENEILVKYDDINCLYYLKNETKMYKYGDYIIDDITNGEYQVGTPSIADYKTGSGMLDYDIDRFVKDRLDYGIKNELIKRYKDRVDEYCKLVKDGSFKERNSYIYFYDLEAKTSTKLNDVLATNISYDDEIPRIYFDIYDVNSNENVEGNEKRKIMLSDIIASNMTLDGYMKVILSKGKIHKAFNMDFEVNDSILAETIVAENENDINNN